jgi:hypothetical protein
MSMEYPIGIARRSALNVLDLCTYPAFSAAAMMLAGLSVGAVGHGRC